MSRVEVRSLLGGDRPALTRAVGIRPAFFATVGEGGRVASVLIDSGRRSLGGGLFP